MTETVNISTGGVGAVYMRVDHGGKTYKFPCAAIDYTMMQNRIPTLTAYVGTGMPLVGRKEDYTTPEIVMEWLADPKEEGLVNGMIACSFYEEASVGGFPSDWQIFKGYIATGNPVYTAKPSGSATQIMFQCLGLAAALVTAPGSAYIECYQGVEIEKKRNGEDISLQRALDTGGNFEMKKWDPLDLIIASGLKLYKAPVVKRIGIFVALACLAASWNHLKDFKDKDPDQRVMDAFGGDTTLDMEQFGVHCDLEYNRHFLSALMTNMASSTLYDCIVGIATSDMFVLEVDPRWWCDSKRPEDAVAGGTTPDFKMDIIPSSVWHARNVINLDASKIISFRASRDALSKLNTPDTILLQFNGANSWLLDSSKTNVIDVMGIATKNSVIDNSTLQAVVTRKTDMTTAKKFIGCRVRQVTAPSWMAMVVSNKSVRTPTKRDTDKGLQVERTPATTNKELTPDDQPDLKRPDTYTEKEIKTAYDAANVMARAIFLHHYLENDTASMDVLPSLRFGLQKGICFEDSIGDTVVVTLPTGTGKPIEVKGVLQGVMFKYSTGVSSSISYTLVLSRLRPASIKEPDMTCPIYKTGRDNK